MTDEEMAEEYVNKNNIEWELDCHRTSPIGEVIQAFLAGLKAGRTNDYAKTIIQDLLNNSDEYARQRAMNFLEKE